MRINLLVCQIKPDPIPAKIEASVLTSLLSSGPIVLDSVLGDRSSSKLAM